MMNGDIPLSGSSATGLASKDSVGREFMMNLRMWKKMGLALTKSGSRTVRFISTLQMVVIAYFELTISNFELSIMNEGSATSTASSAAACPNIFNWSRS